MYILRLCRQVPFLSRKVSIHYFYLSFIITHNLKSIICSQSVGSPTGTSAPGLTSESFPELEPRSCRSPQLSSPLRSQIPKRRRASSYIPTLCLPSSKTQTQKVDCQSDFRLDSKEKLPCRTCRASALGLSPSIDGCCFHSLPESLASFCGQSGESPSYSRTCSKRVKIGRAISFFWGSPLGQDFRAAPEHENHAFLAFLLLFPPLVPEVQFKIACPAMSLWSHSLSPCWEFVFWLPYWMGCWCQGEASGVTRSSAPD